MDWIFKYEIAGHGIWRILLLFVIILAALLLGRIAKYILSKIASDYKAQERIIAGTTLEALGRSAIFLFASIGIVIALIILELHDKVAQVSQTASSILLTLAVGYFFYWLAEIPAVWIKERASKNEKKIDDMIAPVIRKSLRVSIIILVLVQVTQILSDKPITSVIAGLGIGGLAVALAAQDSLKNFFGSIVLLVDKPFEIGERVTIDGHDGSIESVGLRSTRVRTLDGHLVTVPNGELANKTIQNVGKRPFLRRIANITITYDTPPEKIDRALEIIKELLYNHEGMNENLPPRVYFNEFNSASLNILVIYWYHPPDFWSYMQFTEKFNRQLIQRFNEEEIDFAFPTQTLHIAGDKSRPLTVGITHKTENTDNHEGSAL